MDLRSSATDCAGGTAQSHRTSGANVSVVGAIQRRDRASISRAAGALGIYGPDHDHCLAWTNEIDVTGHHERILRKRMPCMQYTTVIREDVQYLRYPIALSSQRCHAATPIRFISIPAVCHGTSKRWVHLQRREAKHQPHPEHDIPHRLVPPHGWDPANDYHRYLRHLLVRSSLYTVHMMDMCTHLHEKQIRPDLFRHHGHDQFMTQCRQEERDECRRHFGQLEAVHGGCVYMAKEECLCVSDGGSILPVCEGEEGKDLRAQACSISG